MVSKKLLLIFIFAALIVEAQEANFNFLPAGVQFLPHKANHQEARIGVLYYPQNGHLKVDVGNNIDLFEFMVFNGTLRFGIEFMAYALSTNYQGRRLQIDAIDGFFGGNMSFKKSSEDSQFLFRFRIIHNSAHFVDGHYDMDNEKWKDDIKPIPFTQDFGEINAGHKIFLDYGGFYYYGGVAYSTLVRPALIQKYSFSAGFEYHRNDVIDSIFGKEVNIFLASHLRYVGMPDYEPSSNNLLGLKFGSWKGKGIVFYISYYYGNNMFSEYYYRRVKELGIGFFVEYF